jgi:4-amino-4-deoxy-L-arabinose transferase-like glycosyltransferase
MLRLYSLRFLKGVNPWLSPCVFLTSSGIFLTGFSAITDMTLSACFTIAVVSAVIALEQNGQSPSRVWGHLFFVALGFGTLTKGPVVLVLAALVIGAWLWTVRDLPALRRLPWKTGLLVYCAVVLPWYAAAEYASPGFLRYFIFEEHFRRYFSSAYQFRYGSVHPRPFGTIWPVMLAMALPWILIFKHVAWRKIRNGISFLRSERGIGFAVMWGLAPLVFFTFSRQILPTYCLPALPGASLVAAALLHRQQVQIRTIVRVGSASLIVYGILLLSLTGTITEERSTKPLLSYFRHLESTHPLNVVFLYRDPFSTHFYDANESGTWINLRTTLDPESDRPFPSDFVVARTGDLERVSADVRDKLHERIRIGKWVVMTACFLKHSISHAAIHAASS